MLLSSSLEENQKNQNNKNNTTEKPKANQQQVLRIDKRNVFGETLLYYVCHCASLLIIKPLLCYGAGVNRARYNGQTPLFVACKNSNNKIVSLLLRYGANVHT